MAVTVQTELMALGGWSIDLNWSAVVQDLLTREDNGRRVPRKVHLIISRGGTPIHPPLPLLRYTPSEEGIQIGGRSPLWWLGSGDIGPVIVDREYVSGANKLGNPSFDLDDLYWRRPAEGSLWVLSGGTAVNVGGYPADDPLESDEKFPTRPGYSYRLDVLDIFGTGRLRQRILFEGQFTPPNLWVNGDLQGGTTGWGASTLVQIVNDPANAYGASGNVMRCLPIPKASWTDNFESGGGWTDETTPAPMSDDIDIIYSPSEAYEGGWVMQVGPVTQHQVFANADFGTPFASPGRPPFWFPSSTPPNVEPDTAIFQAEPGGGVNGSDGIITAGWSTAGRAGPELIKYLRADITDGGGVDPYLVNPGDSYRAELYAHGHPGSDGSLYFSIMQPHPTIPVIHDVWTLSDEIFAPPHDDNRWTVLAIDNITIPANRPELNALVEVHNHSLGYWSFDHFTLTRTRGNRAKIVSDTLIPVEVDTDYEVSALIRNGDDMQVGNVRVGVELQGAGMEIQSEGEDKTSTDFVWDRAARTVRPSAGYTTARFFVAAQDVIGSMWVDHFTLIQLNNNRTSITGSTFPLTPERTYSVRCKFRSGPALSRGNARLRVRLTRAGYPDVLLESTPVDATDNEWRESQALSVTPPSGYDTAVPSVVFTDVEGDFFYAAEFSVTDNDTGTVIVEAVSPTNPAGVDSYVEATAPEGAEWVRALVVAEAGSAHWTIGEMSLSRIGVTPATGLSILQDLVTDPDTGDPLPVSLGATYANDPIPYDWRIANLTAREALDHLCNVIYEPPLEYYIYQSFPPSLIVGPAPTIFTDHLPSGSEPVLYRAQDIDVAELPSVEVDVEDRPTKVRVLGAERKTVSGRDFLITGEAQVPGTAEVDFNGRPVNRTWPVTDASVDHIGYAEALATDLAAKLADPPLSVTAKLHPVDPDSASLLGLDARPEYRVGDWIYVWSPEHGLVEDGYEVMVEGEEINPRRMRVTGATQEHGPQYAVLVRKEDGTIVPLPGVVFSEEDALSLTLGDRPVEWINDPQGGAAGPRYLRDRRAMPR